MSESPNYFSIIPANIRYDKRLKPNEKLLYSEITALCDKNGFCWATNAYFANLYEVDKKTVGVWINHLKELGYIAVEITYKNGTKEIDKRIISIVVNRKEFNETEAEEPSNKIVTPSPQKDGEPPHKKMGTPPHKKMEENNTRIEQYKINKKEINKEKDFENCFLKKTDYLKDDVGKKDFFEINKDNFRKYEKGEIEYESLELLKKLADDGWVNEKKKGFAEIMLNEANNKVLSERQLIAIQNLLIGYKIGF